MTGPPYVRPQSLTGLLYRSIVLSGCLRCPRTHPLLGVNTRPSTHVLVSTMLVEFAELPKALTCWPRCLPFPRLQCHFALPVCRGRHCESPHKGTLVALWGGSGGGCMGPNICLLPPDDTIGAGPCIPLQNVPALCNTCTGLIVVGWREPLTRPSGLS